MSLVLNKAGIHGSPHIGVFCIANDNHAFIPKGAPHKLEVVMRETLDVDVVRTTLMNSNLIGIFSACDSRKALLPADVERHELRDFKERFSEVITLGGGFDAIGNLVAMNDNGVACSPAIYQTLCEQVGCEPALVAGSDLTGSAVFVTNAGFLCHRDSSEAELKKLESLFKSKGSIGTVNLGDPFVRSGLVGNRRGIVAGSRTSGPELGRIDDTFTFVDNGVR